MLYKNSKLFTEFGFILHRINNIDILYIKLFHLGGSFGIYSLPVSALVEQPIKREVRSIVEEKPVQTITLSANVRFA